METALVTGGTGFVGAAVVRALLAEGHRVRALHRPGADLRNLDGLEAECERVVGDLRDVDSLRRAVAGCDLVFHVAALYRFGWKHARDLYEDNQGGTRNILAAAHDAGVRRIVYTSTVGVLHARRDGAAVDESALASFEELAGPYKRSKWLAEKEAMAAASRGVDVVSVCPSAPVGPRDVKPTPTGQMIVDFCRGRMPAYVDTGLNIVDVDDVARGHVLAAERGVAGERYILGSENLALGEILARLAEITGRPPPRWRLPRRLLYPIAWCSEGAARLRGATPRVSLENARMSQTKMFFDDAKARRELGWEPRPARDALARAVEWFGAHGYIRS